MACPWTPKLIIPFRAMADKAPPAPWLTGGDWCDRLLDDCLASCAADGQTPLRMGDPLSPCEASVDQADDHCGDGCDTGGTGDSRSNVGAGKPLDMHLVGDNCSLGDNDDASKCGSDKHFGTGDNVERVSTSGSLGNGGNVGEHLGKGKCVHMDKGHGKFMDCARPQVSAHNSIGKGRAYARECPPDPRPWNPQRGPYWGEFWYPVTAYKAFDGTWHPPIKGKSWPSQDLEAGKWKPKGKFHMIEGRAPGDRSPV